MLTWNWNSQYVSWINDRLSKAIDGLQVRDSRAEFHSYAAQAISSLHHVRHVNRGDPVVTIVEACTRQMYYKTLLAPQWVGGIYHVHSRNLHSTDKSSISLCYGFYTISCLDFVSGRQRPPNTIHARACNGYFHKRICSKNFVPKGWYWRVDGVSGKDSSKIYLEPICNLRDLRVPRQDISEKRCAWVRRATRFNDRFCMYQRRKTDERKNWEEKKKKLQQKSHFVKVLQDGLWNTKAFKYLIPVLLSINLEWSW